ncbi:Ig-like domain-containing protein [Rivularia sp. UHCC 0363]|uniref:Ig-like domain-containing protein n=1 Tax=Rivularia sp. UHCC 0363 TaxID=3110244 RepID=UPI002B208CD6|nr:Ig-like domain-containing protein [Rivularia sp. UHCC 0363]MEA5596108.1 Ig-like domain-containing protein [Rivularia sp. UHCC 0363]
MTTNKIFLQPFDRVALGLILALTVLIGLIILQGDGVKPSVRSFSWENAKIGADDISFNLNFSRPMDIKSVEKNLKIEPPLAGKISWAGRRMVYTLLTPAPYGERYTVELQNAKDKFATLKKTEKFIQPFVGTFRSRDRVILYLGAEAQERGRLVLYNLTQEQKTLLTPKDLVVLDFEAFPDGEKILFSAHTASSQDTLSAQLYTVTTGISDDTQRNAKSPAKVDLVLDSKEYQILKFDLSPDGKTIVLQRARKNDPSDFGLWFLPIGDNGKEDEPKPIKNEQPSGDFLITPDSQAVAVAQGQGTAILPIQIDASKPLDFLPQFGVLQAFSKDGSQAVLVKFNTDYTRDLFLVTNQGTQKQLIKTTGSIIKCEFDPASPTLYCLLTQLLPGESYQEQPYLVAINLKTGQQKALLVLPPDKRDLQMSLSPDGLGLLFDQVVSTADTTTSAREKPLKTDDGQEINTSSLWLMPLLPGNDNDINAELKPEQLPLVGFHPRWLP